MKENMLSKGSIDVDRAEAGSQNTEPAVVAPMGCLTIC